MITNKASKTNNDGVETILKRSNLSSGCSGSSSRLQRKSSTMKGMLKKSFSFSLRPKKAPVRHMLSDVSTNTASTCNTELESSCSLEPSELLKKTKTVRFTHRARFAAMPQSTRAQKLAPATCCKEAWYSRDELTAMMEEAKITAQQYQLKCPQYCSSLTNIMDRCAQAKPGREESIAQLIDPCKLAQLVSVPARGLESQIVGFQPMLVVQQVLQLQAELLHCSSDDKKQELLATKYANLSKTAKVLAKTLADGDALVALTATDKVTIRHTTAGVRKQTKVLEV